MSSSSFSSKRKMDDVQKSEIKNWVPKLKKSRDFFSLQCRRANSKLRMMIIRAVFAAGSLACNLCTKLPFYALEANIQLHKHYYFCSQPVNVSTFLLKIEMMDQYIHFMTISFHLAFNEKLLLTLDFWQSSNNNNNSVW